MLRRQIRLLSTFSQQHTVPRLPVPPLQQSCEKYLKSLRPLLNDEEMDVQSRKVKDFVTGLGATLQSRLQDYDKQQPESWLDDIWLNKAYLEWREPSLINSNWWVELKDGPELMKEAPPRGVLSAVQMRRAAGLVTSLLDYKQKIDREELEPDRLKDRFMCMNQYKNQFGIARIADMPRDRVIVPWPNTATHIVVMIRDQMFKLECFQAGKRVTVKQMEKALYACAQLANDGPKQPPVGILTSEHRDVWALTRKHLTELDPLNAQNFKILDEALFIVCLDDYSAGLDKDKSHHQWFHNHDAHNRWFDKTIELVVSNNGRAGINGEHAPADAVIPGNIFDFMIESEPTKDPVGSIDEALPPPERINWVVDGQVMTAIETAENNAKALIDDTESLLLHFNRYGSDYIKEYGKASPDAYVQMALQLAWARLYDRPTPVYESASTRLFKLGRTETNRSLTVESESWARGFDDDNVLYPEKLARFQQAVVAHITNLRDATFGKGFDRHFLGLRCMMEDSEKESSIFADPAYMNSMWYRLSSSNMSPGRNFYGGFGPVVPDGYGINYAIDDKGIKFSISSKKSCPETSSVRYREELERALRDMRIMFPREQLKK